MNLQVFNELGEATGQTVELCPMIFGVKKIQPEVVHLVATASLANQRKAWAAVKTRGEVSGGGKKPWRQKGTGRARAGSIRSPLWRGGGVIFGPSKMRNFSQKINRKMRHLALFHVLTDRAQNGRLVILDNFTLTEGKTKALITKLENLKTLLHGKKALLVLSGGEEQLKRAARNLHTVRICQAKNLNILNLLWADNVLITKDALPIIEQTYLLAKREKQEFTLAS